MLNGLESIRCFFTAVFFITLGALVTVPTIEMVVLAAIMVVLTACIKPIVTTALLLYSGYEPRSAVLTSLRLDQISEFSLIIAIEAFVLGDVSQLLFNAIILAAAVTMLSSSVSSRYDESIHRLLRDEGLLGQYPTVDGPIQVRADLSDHVIIVGYGRQGQRLVETCERNDRPYVVIENDPLLVDEMHATCRAFVSGDAMERYTWETARIERAALIVSTIDSVRLSKRILAIADGTDVILLAGTATTAIELLERGALYVAVPEVLAAEQLLEVIEQLAAGDVSPAQLQQRKVAELEQERDPTAYRTTSKGKAIW
jgi:CPA2 family monovalent cation:H+ antiporter-2